MKANREIVMGITRHDIYMRKNELNDLLEVRRSFYFATSYELVTPPRFSPPAVATRLPRSFSPFYPSLRLKAFLSWTLSPFRRRGVTNETLEIRDLLDSIFAVGKIHPLRKEVSKTFREGSKCEHGNTDVGL